jgi:hypothetical protein
MEDTVEYILRLKVPLSRADEIEPRIVAAAKNHGAQLSRTQREEHGTYSLHKSRKMLVRP